MNITNKIVLFLLFTICYTLVEGQNTTNLASMKAAFEKRKPALDTMMYTPSDWGLAYQSFQVETIDSISIAGWFIPNDKKIGTIIMAHGFAMNKSHMLKRAKYLYQHGFSLLLFDFRARGESSGEKASTGVANGADIKAVYTYYVRHYSQFGESILYGFSHGGRAMLFGAAGLPNPVKLILESPPYLLAESFKREYKIPYMPPMDEQAMNEALTLLAAQIPTLLLIGDDDTAIIESEARELIAKLPHPRSKLVLFENTKHHVFTEHNLSQYEKEILDFINE